MPGSTHPPEEQRTTVSAAEVTTGITLSVVFVVALNLLAGRYLDLHPTNPAKAIVTEKWRLALHPPANLGWLVVGDSSANQGVDTRLLAKATGQTALNVATVGDFGVVGDAWMLQALVAAGGRPARVVVVHVCDVWWRGLDVLEHVVTRLRPPVDVTRFAPRLDWSARQRARLAWNHHFMNRFPFYTQNESLTWLLFHPLGVVAPPRVPLDSTGFEVQPEPSPEQVDQDSAELRKLLRALPTTPGAEQLAALETISRVAREVGAKTYLQPSPLWDALAGDPDVRPVVDRVGDVLTEFARSHPDVVLLSREPFWLPANQLQSADHATEAGAQRFTAAILERVERYEEGAGDTPEPSPSPRLEPPSGP